MKQRWEDYEKAADKGPVAVIVKIIIGAVLVLMLLGAIGYIGGFFTDATNTFQQEVKASTLLKKYSWFKDASAALDKKLADVKVYQHRLTNMENSYKDLPRYKWPRDDREQYNVWVSEVSGIKASYNTLASEYNAQMSKINWAFTNIGELPRGAERPLPREYKPYTTQ